MGQPKADALALIAALPDDATWADIHYRVSVCTSVERGIAAAAAGDVVPHEEAQRQIEEWLHSSGLDRLSQTSAASAEPSPPTAPEPQRAGSGG